MAKWIQKAVKHPGKLAEDAKRAGVSEREEAKHLSHSSDPSKRGEGNLGLRFMKGGDLHHGGSPSKRKKSPFAMKKH